MFNPFKLIIVITLAATFILLPKVLLAEDSMLNYFFKTVDVDLCPEVKGRIVNKGKPVAGINILRQLEFNGGDIIEDNIQTSSNGDFFLPAKNIKVPKRKISIAANVITQRIVIVDKNKKYRKWSDEQEYRLWFHTRYGFKENLSINNKLKQLDCELSNKEVYFLFDHNSKLADEPKYNLYGRSICRWSSDFYIYKTYH